MRHYRVTLEGVLSSSTGELDFDEASEMLLRTMTELYSLTSAGNSAIDIDFKTGDILVTCTVLAETALASIQPASDNIRLALRAGDIGTTDWPNPDDPEWQVNFVNQRAEALASA